MGLGMLVGGFYHPSHGSPRNELETPAKFSLLQAAFDLLPDGVAIIRHDGDVCRLVSVNRVVAEMVGRSVPDLLEEPVPFADIPCIHAALQRCLAEIQSNRLQASVEVIAGEIANVPQVLRLQAIPIGDDSCSFRGCVVVLRDISGDQSRDHAVLRDERMVGIGLLATGIAHEINNPLGSALLAAETALAIKDNREAGEHLTACLNNIIASTDRCGRIVRTLLRYARDEPTERQCCSLNDVAEQAIDQMRSYAEAQEAVVLLERDPQVPLAPMNPLEIELVLVNLIRNAIQACDQHAKVLVRTEWPENRVRVSVSDNGRGMTGEQITHMFEPMYPTRKKAGGFGFGLGIASGIVQRHQGTMEVVSKPGTGTTITVDLPIQPGVAGNDANS